MSPHLEIDVEGRLALLDRVVEALTRLTGGDRAGMLEDEDGLAATKYHLVTAMACCGEIARGAIHRRGLRIPRDRLDVFVSLAEGGVLDAAHRDDLVALDSLRYRLVQLCWDVEPEDMMAELDERLPALRQFVDQMAPG